MDRQPSFIPGPMPITEVDQRHVTVMGLGTFGGGIGAVRYLVRHGARVTVTDLRNESQLARSLAQLADISPIQWRLGEHRQEDFVTADVVVASPAISPAHPLLQAARERGAIVTTEINLLWERLTARTVCVTGSNGKSTTSSLIHAILSRRQTPRCWLGGNIGGSLLSVVEQIAPDDWVVLELSSFQLEWLAALQPRPDVAVVTNFSPNHLDRHGSLAAYRAAKQRLMQWQRPDQWAILNSDDTEVRDWPGAARRRYFGLRDIGSNGELLQGVFGMTNGENSNAASSPSGSISRSRPHDAVIRIGADEVIWPIGDWLKLPGNHNLLNGLAAACGGLTCDVQIGEISDGLISFRGLPHRLQTVAERAGRRFVNDSKATTPEAALLAIGALQSSLWLIAGGYDKHLDLLPFVQGLVAARVRGVALIGETAAPLQRLLDDIDPRQRIMRRTCASLAEAVSWCGAHSAAGDVILLSPACASLDQFVSYEARGDEFSRLAQHWQPLTP